jgi:hypothetical protein
VKREAVGPVGRSEDLRAIAYVTRLLVGREHRLRSNARAAEAILAELHPEAALKYWVWNRVVLLAVSRARSLGVERPPWDHAEASLRNLARARAVTQELTALKVTRMLARENIRSVCLKGPLLGRRLFESDILRDPSVDVDILVSASNLAVASRVIEAHGWTSAGTALTQGELPEHHLEFRGPSGTPDVELHWRVQWYDRYQHTDQILRNAVAPRGIPEPADADINDLLLLCWARDGFHRLRHAADLGAWGDLRTPSHQVRPYPATLTAPLEATALVAGPIVGGDPKAIVPTFRGIRLGLAARIAEYDSETEPRLSHSRIALVDLLICDRADRLRSLRTKWFRDPAFLRSRHPKLATRWSTPILRAVSCLRTASGAVRLLTEGRSNRIQKSI